MISLQDSHLSQFTENVSCPFKEQLCKTVFLFHVWHVTLLLCTIQTLIWGKNCLFPCGWFSLAHHSCNWSPCGIIFAEICVCVSKWWGLAGPSLLHGREVLRAWCSRCRGFAANPDSIFWIHMSSWSALGGGAGKAMSSLIVPKEIQPVCPREPQECRLKHGEWGWQGDSLQKHAADQT